MRASASATLRIAKSSAVSARLMPSEMEASAIWFQCTLMPPVPADPHEGLMHRAGMLQMLIHRHGSKLALTMGTDRGEELSRLKSEPQGNVVQKRPTSAHH